MLDLKSCLNFKFFFSYCYLPGKVLERSQDLIAKSSNYCLLFLLDPEKNRKLIENVGKNPDEALVMELHEKKRNGNLKAE